MHRGEATGAAGPREGAAYEAMSGAMLRQQNLGKLSAWRARTSLGVGHVAAGEGEGAQGSVPAEPPDEFRELVPSARKRGAIERVSQADMPLSQEAARCAEPRVLAE